MGLSSEQKKTAKKRAGSSNLKVAMVANTTWNIYNFRQNVLSKLTEKGYKLYVIAPIDEYIHYKDNFPDLIHIPLRYLSRKSVNPFKDLLLIWEFIQIYRRIRPDIVMHYTVKPNIYGGMAAGILRIPSLAVVTGLGYAFIHKGLIKEITILLYRFSSRFHRKFIFENRDDLLLFEDQKMIRHGQGVAINGCGINTRIFKPVPVQKEDSPLVFTFIGRLIYDKGIKEFVGAASRIKEEFPNVQFWVLGEIDNNNPAAIRKKDLLRWVQEKSIIYHGSKENIRKYIGASDCIVLPSYREGMPKVLLESMSMGKPIITTDSPGCREAVDHGYNGLLVPVKNVPMLTEAIKTMIHSGKKVREEMGSRGRQKAMTEFDADMIATRMATFVKEVSA